MRAFICNVKDSGHYNRPPFGQKLVIIMQHDLLRRFIFEHHGVRGVWVRLEQSWQQAKQHQNIVNTAVDQQLGQALAAASILASIIKFNGALIMQFQGSGELKALVAQATHQRTLRGLVRSAEQVEATTLKTMLGASAHLVLTIESNQGEPYQGIIAIESEHMSGVLQDYFQQSEQLPTRLWLFANATHAAGLMIQQLPGTNDDGDAWQRLQMLADTVSADELLNLDCESLLHRLFHEEQVRLFEAESVAFKCSCSRQKIADTLLALGENELQEIFKHQHQVEVDCQFCGAQYCFTPEAVAALTQVNTPESPTLH